MPEDRDTELSHDILNFTAELRRLADALEAGGTYPLQIDGEVVQIPADALFSVAHERQAGEIELEFQISWSEVEGDEVMDQDIAETEDDAEERETA